MESAAAEGERPSAHLTHPLLGQSEHPQPYYAYPAAAYAYAPSPPPPPPTLVLLPSSPVFVRLRRLRPRRISCIRRFSTRTLPLLLVLALLAGLAFLLYPSAPEARVANIHLDRFRINPPPLPALDFNLALSLGVRNPGLILPLRYLAVSATVSYRGHLLGSATARPGSGELAARGVTYAYSEVWVDAGSVLDDVIELIGDIAAGSVPLEIVTEIVGTVSVFRFDIPVKARDVFVAKEAVLQKKISQEMERAKEFTKSGNKQAAMQCLKRKKYYESQMNQVGSVRLRINTKEKMIADNMGNK